MKKEDIIQMGLNEEQAEKFVDVLKKYVPLHKYEELEKEKDLLTKQLQERGEQLEQLKQTVGDGETMKKELERLQEFNKEQEKKHSMEIKKLKIESEVTRELTAARAINLKAAMPFINMDALELNEDGSVKGLLEQIKKIAESKDTNFLFEKESKPQFKGVAPGESGVEEPDRKVDISQLSYDELCAYITENPDTNLEQ